MTSSNGNIFRVTGHWCGEFTGPGEIPAQRPVTRSLDVSFGLHLNKRLSKQSWGWWFEILLIMTIIVKKISHAVEGDNIWKHYEIFWEELHIVFWCLIGTKPCKNDCLRSKLFPIAPVSKPEWHDSGLISFEKNILSLNSKLWYSAAIGYVWGSQLLKRSWYRIKNTCIESNNKRSAGVIHFNLKSEERQMH